MPIPIVLTTADIANFWGCVDKKGPHDCWPWLQATDRDGYGLFSPHLKSPQYKAHRVACFLEHGGAGQMTCHTCNNPTCCNPAHLYPGTGKQNSRDRDKEGCPWQGEKCHLAKLTDTQVTTTAQLFLGGLTNRQIANKVGCKRRLVERIRIGECWSWLTGIEKKVYGLT